VVTVGIEPTDLLFDEATPVPRGLVTGGRYRLPNRDGSHHPYGWQRVTNLVGAYSDTRALALWQQRMILLGLRARPDLYEELHTMAVDTMDAAALRRELEYLADQAQTAAKADVGRRRGTARHAMVAHFHEGGEVVGTPSMRAQLTSYNEVLDAHRLRPVAGLQERVIICEALNCAGRYDNALEDLDTAVWHIADLKTQRQFWTLLEVRAQLAIYAHADAMWDEERECYVGMPPVNQELGLVMHMPQEPEHERDPVEILNIDLVKGWQTARHAYQVVCDRSEAKSAGTLRSVVRPLPAPALTVVRTVEEYAARFASVATREEGKALVAEVMSAGMWCPELLACARKAEARITGQNT
jgi:hypothetical protein